MNEIANKLNNYLEVSKYVENESITALLNSFVEKNEANRYELPLIGQFSSGKSATINHLLGRDLLPTKRVETTAFATFISYSKDEYAQLELVDGSIENISLDEIKLLDNDKVEKSGKQIKTLSIGIESSILESGLTLVDTPGVNTIITTHIDITERILREAQYIIYVLAKDLTEEDVLMIQTIEMKNIPMIFVRTHLDSIHNDEENWQTVEKESKSNIEKQLGHSIRFFAISNDETRLEFESNFKDLTNYLNTTIALNIQEVYSKAMEERLVPIKKDLLSEINAKLSILENNQNKSLKDIEKQKRNIELMIDSWNEKSSKQQNDVSEKGQKTKEDIKNRISIVRDECIKNFAKIVKNTEPKIDDLNKLLANSLSKDSSKINFESEQLLFDAAKTVCSKIGEDIKSVNTELETIGIDSDCTFDLSIVQDYTERMNKIDEDYQRNIEKLDILKEEIQSDQSIVLEKRREIEDAIAQAESQIQIYRNNVDNVKNSYEPVYVTKESSLAPIGKVVGNVLDIAMLFIPGPTWAKIGAKVGKIGTAGSTIRKIGKVGQKAAQVLAKTDAAKDAMTLLGGVKNAVAKSNGTLNKTSVFDYVSLSYWFEKAGNMIDPATVKLDKDYEAAFASQLREVQLQLQIAESNKIKQIQQLARLNGPDWANEQKKKEIEKNQKLLSQKRNEIKIDLDKQMKDDLKKSLISQAEDQYKEKITEYSSILSERIDTNVDSIFSSILEAADMKIKGTLNTLSFDLSEVIQNMNTSEEDFNKKISTLKDLKEKMQ